MSPGLSFTCSPFAILVERRAERRMCSSWEPCCFSLCNLGRLRGTRDPLSARGRDGDSIRPSVCGDQGAEVNQRPTDPLITPRIHTPRPWHALRLFLSHRHTLTKSMKARSHFHLLFLAFSGNSATPSGILLQIKFNIKNQLKTKGNTA